MIDKKTVARETLRMIEREPTEPEIGYLEVAATEAELRARIAALPDFYRRPEVRHAHTVATHERLAAINLPIQTSVSEDQLVRLLEQTQKAWLKLGTDDPFWSVVSSDSFRRERMSRANVEVFYASSEGEIEIFKKCLDRSGFPMPKRLVEIGCGVGRMTHRFASMFDHVTGVDISKSHLDIATREVFRRAPDRSVSFVQITDPQDYATLSNFDCIYSLLVLQHSPPPIMLHILDALLGRLNPGGLVYFQVPTFDASYSFETENYLKWTKGEMEMHCLPQSAIFQVMAKHGVMPIEVVSDSAGLNYMLESLRFFGKKA